MADGVARRAAWPRSSCRRATRSISFPTRSCSSSTVNDGAIVAPGGRYRCIVVPATRRMSVETLGTVARPRQARGARGVRIPAAGCARFRAPGSTPRQVAHAARGSGIARRSGRRKPGSWFGCGKSRRLRPDSRTSAALAPTVTTTSSPTSRRGIRRLAAARHAGRIRDDAGSADRTHRNGGREARENGKSARLSTAGAGRIHAGTHLAHEGRAQGAALALREALCAGIALQGEWSLEFIKGGPVLPGPAA